MKLEIHAQRIMQKMKGYRPKDMADDLREFPEAHAHELNWILLRLKRIRGFKKCKCRGKKK